TSSVLVSKWRRKEIKEEDGDMKRLRNLPLTFLLLLYVCLLTTTLASSGFIPLKTAYTKVAVPSYFYPGQLWTQMEKGVPTVGLALLNPDSGPGPSKNTAYVNQVKDTGAMGITVIGYVPTAYAGTHNVTRTLAAAKQDVDKYYN